MGLYGILNNVHGMIYTCYARVVMRLQQVTMQSWSEFVTLSEYHINKHLTGVTTLIQSLMTKAP